MEAPPSALFPKPPVATHTTGPAPITRRWPGLVDRLMRVYIACRAVNTQSHVLATLAAFGAWIVLS